MSHFKKLFFLFVVLNFSLNQAKAVPNSFADLAEKLMPSVVNISTTQTVRTTTNQFPFQFPPDLLLAKCLKILIDPLREKPHL